MDENSILIKKINGDIEVVDRDFFDTSGYAKQAKTIISKNFAKYAEFEKYKYLFLLPIEDVNADIDLENVFEKFYGTTYILTDTEIYFKNELIGSGTFSNVYKCYSPVSNKFFAIKEIAKKDEKTIEAIKYETDILRQLDNPHIIKVSDFLETEDTIYIVFENICQDVIYKEINTSEQLRQMIVHILNILVYLKQNNVVHLDIKPQNFLDCQDNLVLSDFGFAKIVNEPIKLSVILGTPRYIAPEVLLKHSFTTEPDMWSAAGTIYNFIYGQCAFVDTTRIVLYRNIKEFNYVRPRRLEYMDDSIYSKLEIFFSSVFVPKENRMTPETALNLFDLN